MTLRLTMQSFFGFAIACVIASEVAAGGGNCIRPYAANPAYWQYKGAPVLLLGGSKTDHIFLLDNLETHLDEIVSAGGNYVRCTMSQREGADLKPHRLLPDGKFDLTQWNEDYWRRFANCLAWCEARDIIVQIELWDRFDYSQQEWAGSAWRPANNVNYTGEESGLADAYPAPAYRDKQPFFYTVPGLARYDPRYDWIRKFQDAFVEKVLLYSLKYGNVLYCINNEGSCPPEWSVYWANRVLEKAKEAGVETYVTEMYDACRLEPVVSRPDVYGFVDGSKILGPRKQAWAPKGEGQWQMVLDTQAAMGGNLRPINAVKIICNPDAEVDAYSRRKFWRALMAGMGAIRFHRAPVGAALDDAAKACLQSARKLESRVKLWDVEPHQELLRDRSEDEAYLRAAPGKAYVLYFPNSGSVGLDLNDVSGTFEGRWIAIETGEWGDTFACNGGAVASIAAPGSGAWLAVCTRADGAGTV